LVPSSNLQYWGAHDLGSFYQHIHFGGDLSTSHKSAKYKNKLVLHQLQAEMNGVTQASIEGQA